MTDTLETQEPGYKLHGSPTQGLWMGTWGFFIGFAGVALYGPAANYFQKAMGLSGVALGLLVAAPQLTGSLMRIPFGAWVDKVGGRLPMLTLFGFSLTGLWGLAFILTAVKDITASLYPLVVFFGFLSGFGVASFSVGIPQVSYWFPQHRQGIALGTYGGVGNLAPGIFTLCLPLAIVAFGLAGSYLLWFLFLLVGTVIYAIFAPDAYFFQLRKTDIAYDHAIAISKDKGQELFPSESVWQGVITAAEDVRTWGLVALYFTSFGGFLALTVWFPVYWINLHGMSPITAGILGGVGFSLVSAVVRVVGGFVSERLGGELTALIAFLMVLLAALILSVNTEFYIDLGAELLIATGMGIGNAAVFKMLPKYVPEAVGGASGLVGGLGALGGFLIPPFLGATVDAMGVQGYAGGFFAYVLLGIMAIGTSIYFIALDRRTQTN